MKDSLRANIMSVGTYVPDMVMTNKDFESFLDTSNEWIVTRTGIKERHIVPRDNPTPTWQLGANAARRALEKAKIPPEQVDGIICATITPDTFFPSTACRIQAALGCVNAFAFDMAAACAGFVFALSVANGYLASGQARTLLVIGSEVLSKSVDWTDRSICILFGDGAGAAVVQGTTDPGTGLLSACLASDGRLGDIVHLSAWGDKQRQYMYMNGKEVFKHAVRMMADIAVKVTAQAGLTLDKIDLFIPHQANIRIINAIMEQLKLPPEKLVTNLERYGNTSSASIPLALDEVWSNGRLKKGMKVLLTSLGGGIAAASAVVGF